MPFIHIRIGGPNLTSEQTSHLQEAITNMMASILGKRADLTSVFVEQTSTSGWSIGALKPTVTAHIDAKITAGSNTPDEKRQFIVEAHKLLKAQLGPELPMATYVIIDEIPGDSWGYGGLSQAQRASEALSHH